MMEFESVAALNAHYKAVRKRLMGTPPPPAPKVVVPTIIRPIPPIERPKTSRPISELSVEDYLRYVGRLRVDLTFLNILALTAREFNITYKEIRSKQRFNRIVIPRQIAVWFSIKHKVQTCVHISHYIDQDHTTVIHAYKKMERQIREDGTLKQRILTTEDILLAAFNRTPLPANH